MFIATRRTQGCRASVDSYASPSDGVSAVSEMFSGLWSLQNEVFAYDEVRRPRDFDSVPFEVGVLLPPSRRQSQNGWVTRSIVDSCERNAGLCSLGRFVCFFK